MKNLFFLLAFMFLFSCGSSTFNCGTIDSKYEKDGKYYFSLILSNTGGGGQNLWRCICRKNCLPFKIYW